MNLLGVAEEIQHRIIHIFGRDIEGKRATNGGNEKLDRDPHFRDYLHFYEVNDESLLIDQSIINSFRSSSTRTMGMALERLIRLVGLDSSRSTLCKPA